MLRRQNPSTALRSSCLLARVSLTCLLSGFCLIGHVGVTRKHSCAVRAVYQRPSTNPQPGISDTTFSKISYRVHLCLPSLLQLLSKTHKADLRHGLLSKVCRLFQAGGEKIATESGKGRSAVLYKTRQIRPFSTLSFKISRARHSPSPSNSSAKPQKDGQRSEAG